MKEYNLWMGPFIVGNITYLDPNTPPCLLVYMSSWKQSNSSFFSQELVFVEQHPWVMKIEDKLGMDYNGVMDDMKKIIEELMDLSFCIL